MCYFDQDWLTTAVSLSTGIDTLDREVMHFAIIGAQDFHQEYGCQRILSVNHWDQIILLRQVRLERGGVQRGSQGEQMEG